ncbi:MAG: COX15/CtaA family protein [Patulibacter sp.]|nr:COX15/CtaA family protein [Patulibacter sp.]
MARTTSPSAVDDTASAPEPRRLGWLRRRFTSSPERMLLAARIALVTNVGIMLSGGLVRVSGSGLGCSNWPKCDTRVLPSEVHAPTFIEFGNRLLTFAVGAAAIFAIFCALTQVRYRKDFTVLSVVLLLGVALQAVIGGLSVLYDLDWIWISAHYLVSILVLLVPAVMLVWRAGQDTRAPREPGAPDRLTRSSVLALLPLGVLALAAGTLATASGPHGGGAGTGDVVQRFDIHGTGTLEWVVQRHGAISAIFGLAIVVAWVVAKTRGASPQLQLTLTGAALLVALQGVIGLIQYGLELPHALVWVHVALSAITWVAVAWAWQNARLATQPV